MITTAHVYFFSLIAGAPAPGAYDPRTDDKVRGGIIEKGGRFRHPSKGRERLVNHTVSVFRYISYYNKYHW